MQKTVTQQPTTSRRRILLKAISLVLFIIAAISIIRFTPVKEFLTQESIRRLLEETGFWAPLIYIVIYAAGICFFVPGTLLTAIGAAIFGPYWGFVYVWVGAMIGASGAFWIGRTLGREFAASMIGDRLKKYDDAIERNGFATVLYLRLVYFPFTAMNFGMGLTRVRFLGLFLWHGFRHYRRNVHLHFLHRYPQGSLGQWELGKSHFLQSFFLCRSFHLLPVHPKNHKHEREKELKMRGTKYAIQL